MIVTGFDGKNHKFNFSKFKFRNKRSGKSSYHEIARSLIKEVFVNRSVYEEVSLPGSKRPGRPYILYADFFIPDYCLIIEVHGEQHYSYSQFFHKDKMDFLLSQRRDQDKIEWCKLNNFDILTLPFYEKKEWKTILLKYLD